ncbi:unnamed protein product [Prorocentrum cordatum]|uniref:Secreted protein n=1 Tax=Prorocentrum cordatum TaxID=2364126 RepID=A0ABN9XIC3_9DINO|nr:unnamed protein product [Polarella glacialis]
MDITLSWCYWARRGGCSLVLLCRSCCAILLTLGGRCSTCCNAAPCQPCQMRLMITLCFLSLLNNTRDKLLYQLFDAARQRRGPSFEFGLTLWRSFDVGIVGVIENVHLDDNRGSELA